MEDIVVGRDILSTHVESGVLLANSGDAATGEAEVDAMEWWQHQGFVSRPVAAKKGSAEAVQVVVIRSTQHDAVIASRDLKGMKSLGPVGEGDAIIYAVGADGKASCKVAARSSGAVEVDTTLAVGASPEGVALASATVDALNLLKAAITGLGGVVPPAFDILVKQIESSTLKATK